MKLDITHITQAPGVYLFKDERGTVIYVGKALNLRRRVGQYFHHDSRPQIPLLLTQIDSLDTIQTASEFDALLLEAKLIAKYMPKYNRVAKDDKSPLYIALMLSEDLPRILFLRGKQLSGLPKHKKDAIFGPFQSGRVARSLMRDLRRSIPYCSQKRRSGSPCFYTHLGLCSPCPSYISKLPDGAEKKSLKRQYRANLIRLSRIMNGRGSRVLREMGKDMTALAKSQRFEQASNKKLQIEALMNIYTRRYDVSLYTDQASALSLLARSESEVLTSLLGQFFSFPNTIRRVECIDISNIGGRSATGSLVVATDGILDTGQYRKFRIRSLKTPNDVAMIEEVVRRRFSHNEWPKPDLLLIDGGKAQLGRALAVLAHLDIVIPTIGLAKRLEEIIVCKDGVFGVVRIALTSPALHILQRLRDQAHRFALSYHRKLRKVDAFATMRSR